MANKRFWLGILVMALVFGLTVVGCNDLTSEKTPQEFTIRNNTEDYISSVYHRVPGIITWTNTYYSISTGGSVTIAIPDNQDIQLRTSNGNLYTKLSQKYGTITFTSSDLDSSSPRTITIGNGTSDYISSVYYRLPDTITWTNSYYSISVGSSVSITIPFNQMDSQYRTDIQLRTSNGNTYTILSQLITHNGNVTFTNSDFDSESSRTVTIGNGTSDYISSVYYRAPGTITWTNTYYSISTGSSVSITIPNNQMDSQYRTDIQLRTSNGNLYTKLSQLITHNGNVIFTNSDFDSSSPRTITIGNGTSNYISSVYYRLPGTSTWTNTYYSISTGSSVSITIPFNQMDSQYRTDIQLRTSGGKYIHKDISVDNS
jgi:hypothetical protein